MTMDLLWLVPTFPLIGFAILVGSQGQLGQKIAALVGSGSIVLSAIVALIVGMDFIANGSTPYSLTLWSWMEVGGFNPSFTLYLDGLSLVMMGVITGVGSLIHVYATGYMAGEDGYARFFSYMNLFVFAMLMLVLGDNLLVLYLGWEGVGLCSYLLIGFYHSDSANGLAARKAFVVTRVGDTAMALGLFLLFRELGTLEIQQVLIGANEAWVDGSSICTAIALLLLGGAVGKSAQLPLQTWLPDAMAGPTPVSALIHAATMVTAGVYLIARMHDLYLLSPTVQLIVAIVGLLTLFISAFTALVQTDIKRVLAYSTMSQIGYMFLALGVGAWSAAIFHLMTHAFFKALLFLAAGSVILAMHHEQNINRMGGLWRKLPVPFISMLVGCAALAALPLTSGFYSKDAILLTSWEYEQAGQLFWLLSAIAAFITSLYSTRLIGLVFFGTGPDDVRDDSGLNMTLPLCVLSLLALGGGWFGLSSIDSVLPDHGLHGVSHSGILPLVTAGIPILGVLSGYLIFIRKINVFSNWQSGRAVNKVNSFLLGGWGFDTLYDRIFVKPFVALGRANKNDFVDAPYRFVVSIARGFNQAITVTQTGRLRWYAASMVLGLIVIFLILLGVL